jgi:hypothetical protein
MHGSAPEQLAPLCFNLASRNKLQALSEGRWMCGLQSISSKEQLEQFVGLWWAVQQVQLTEELTDSITWTLPAEGQYSAKSAYEAKSKNAYLVTCACMLAVAALLLCCTLEVKPAGIRCPRVALLRFCEMQLLLFCRKLEF